MAILKSQEAMVIHGDAPRTRTYTGRHENNCYKPCKKKMLGGSHMLPRVGIEEKLKLKIPMKMTIVGTR